MAANVGATEAAITSWPQGVSLTPNDFLQMLEAIQVDTVGGAAVAALANAGNAFGSVAAERSVKVGRLALTGAAIHAGTGGVIAWTNPEAGSIIILNVHLAVTTVSTGACTLDIGTTATSATTTSDNIFDGLDATTTAPVYYSMSNAALDTGANIDIKPLAAGKWVTIDEKTGDATGLVGVLYIAYILV